MPRSQRDINIIIDEMNKRNIPINQQAYILGTAERETGNTFTVRREEYNNTPQSWFTYINGGWQYHGRGYVQISHDYNYKWATDVLRKNFPDSDVPDLLKHPDYLYGGSRELYKTGVTPPDPDTLSRMHATLMIEGMLSGQFGKPLGNYVSDTKKDYYNARASVNSADKKTYQMVANMATSWEKYLVEQQRKTNRYLKPDEVVNQTIDSDPTRYVQPVDTTIDWNDPVIETGVTPVSIPSNPTPPKQSSFTNSTIEFNPDNTKPQSTHPINQVLNKPEPTVSIPSNEDIDTQFTGGGFYSPRGW